MEEQKITETFVVEKIKEFLNKNPDFTLVYEHTFMPHIDNTDGFYCALIKKA